MIFNELFHPPTLTSITFFVSKLPKEPLNVIPRYYRPTVLQMLLLGIRKSESNPTTISEKWELTNPGSVTRAKKKQRKDIHAIPPITTRLINDFKTQRITPPSPQCNTQIS